MYASPDGDVVDETELPAAFYRKLLYRHTTPGDIVVDLFSGSRAFAWEAFTTGRSVIAVEQDAVRFHCICNRLRGAELLTVSNSKELEKRVNTDDSTQRKAFQDNDDEESESEWNFHGSDDDTDDVSLPKQKILF